DLPAVAFGREIDQAGLYVAQDDPHRGDAFDVGLERLGGLAVLVARRPSAVAGDDLLHVVGRPQERLAGRAHAFERLAEVGARRRGPPQGDPPLGGRLQAVGRRHRPSTPGSSSSEVMRTPENSSCRPRLSSSTPVIPSASAGSTSYATLSPT